MREKFQELEHVEGLKKIVAISRNNGDLIYASENVDTTAAAAASLDLLNTVSALPAQITHLTVTLPGERILIYLIRDHMLTLYVDRMFDINALRTRLKGTAVKPKEKPAKKETVILPRLEVMPLELNHIEIFAHAVEEVSSQAIEELGVFVSANALKDIREELSKEHTSLLAFLVNKNGKITIRLVNNETLADATRAVALWMYRFFDHCHKIVPAFPPELVLSLLEPIRPELTGLGFYEAWQEARDATAEH